MSPFYVKLAAVDHLDPEDRSLNMAKVRGKNTKPELIVRRALHAMGFRFRLHRRDLPGSPDIVLPRRRTAVFVHGCFWHRHPGCPRATTPSTNTPFWKAKFDRNVERDRGQVEALTLAGWNVAIVWECEVRDPARLRTILRDRLDPR